MMSENEMIKQKLIERVADLEVARNRWIFAVVFASLLFGTVLALYLFPASELSTERYDNFKVTKDTTEGPVTIELVAIPVTYQAYFEFTMDKEMCDEHCRVYIYLFKEDVPDMRIDVTGDDLHSYLKAKAVRNASLTYSRSKIDWELAFRDADTTTFNVVFYNPDNPEDPYDNLDVVFQMKSYYEPLFPLLPIFFILAFILILPLAIIRIYIITQKKKELRVLLTLDLENLSDEDKVRLGIPVTPRPRPSTPQPQAVVPTYAPMQPAPAPGARPQAPPPSAPPAAQPAKKGGYMTVDEL